MLWRQDPHGCVRDQVGPFDHHNMDQAIVIFNVPFQCALMSGICMAFDPFYLSIHSFGRLYEVIFVLVMHAEAPSLSISACKSELNMPEDAVLSFAQVVVIPVRVALRTGLPLLCL